VSEMSEMNAFDADEHCSTSPALRHNWDRYSYPRERDMPECFLSDGELSDGEIRKLDRDLRILIATDGTLTRILNVVADDEIVVDIIKQQIHDVAPKVPELDQLPSGRVLQRHILLKGRNSGNAFVAAESLIAIDLLPPTILTSLTKTDRSIGEVMAASCLETFKETAQVWIGEFPGWLARAGYQNSRPRTVTRRYRIITGGQPALIITEYFLVFQGALYKEPDRWQHSNDIDPRSKDGFALNDRVPRSP
jgi:chorismate lyase